ncbi:MAG: DUF222 domain-containing protein [Geodermatophilaceae bacterium]|nr:DUF222 domain-containing protein [Geodermatophilaceae bacterium]
MSTDQDHSGGTVNPAHTIASFAERVNVVLDGLAEAPAWSMTAEEQRTALVGLSVAQARLVELRLRVLAAGDNNDIGKDEAASSTSAWLAHRTRQERPRAHADVRLALALDAGYDATRRALAGGVVNEAQARVIVDAVADLPETVPSVDRGRAEAHLIGLAADYDAKALRVFGRKIFEVIDPDAAEKREGEKLAKQEREAARRAYLKIFDNGDGSVTGRFKIPVLHAAMLKKALHAITAPRATGNQGRVHPDGTKIPHADLLGRAFCELIERFPTKRLPKAGGLNAIVVVTMTLEQLRSGLGAAGLDTGEDLSAGQTRRLACEAGIIPAVLGGKSQVLDLGRNSRFHDQPQRIALGIRDRGCTAENCDRPPGWCHAHHEKPWSQGGATSVEQGRLLCPWHHTKAHDQAYDMTRLPTGKVRFHRRT